ncbi:MAG: hypothetical protein JWO45_1922, partial [Spartobacteria bacterium]|nr:hypothetical protein [Spartobacteria bacterium]
MRVFVTSIPKSGTHLLVDIIKRTHNCYSFGFSKHHALALRQYGRNQLLDVLTGFGDGVALYGHFRLGDWEDLADY